MRWCRSISMRGMSPARPERLAKKMASMAVPSSASAASAVGDVCAAEKPKLKKRKGLDDSSTESAEAADSDPQERWFP